MMDTPVAANDRDLLTTVDVISELCWKTHRAWETVIGEDGDFLIDFNDMEEFEKDSIRESVKWFIAHPTASLSQEHEAWCARKEKTEPDHPNIASYDDLPFSQQVKIRLWRHTILAVIG
jgi:hypothetical protein